MSLVPDLGVVTPRHGSSLLCSPAPSATSILGQLLIAIWTDSLPPLTRCMTAVAVSRFTIRINPTVKLL